jgi:hypothetical protein
MTLHYDLAYGTIGFIKTKKPKQALYWNHDFLLHHEECQALWLDLETKDGDIPLCCSIASFWLFGSLSPDVIILVYLPSFRILRLE